MQRDFEKAVCAGEISMSICVDSIIANTLEINFPKDGSG
jgi:hypothetical protein